LIIFGSNGLKLPSGSTAWIPVSCCVNFTNADSDDRHCMNIAGDSVTIVATDKNFPRSDSEKQEDYNLYGSLSNQTDFPVLNPIYKGRKLINEKVFILWRKWGVKITF
jgi:hypothetical protein